MIQKGYLMATKIKKEIKSIRLTPEEEKEVRQIIKNVKEEEEKGIKPDFEDGTWHRPE